MDKYKGSTPGPWAVTKSIVHPPDQRENYICEVAGFPIGWTIEEMVNRGAERDATAIANTKLIADAPMLAERVEEQENEQEIMTRAYEQTSEALQDSIRQGIKLAEQNDRMLAFINAHDHLPGAMAIIAEIEGE